jgi:hypothetical protein
MAQPVTQLTGATPVTIARRSWLVGACLAAPFLFVLVFGLTTGGILICDTQTLLSVEHNVEYHPRINVGCADYQASPPVQIPLLLHYQYTMMPTSMDITYETDNLSSPLRLTFTRILFKCDERPAVDLAMQVEKGIVLRSRTRSNLAVDKNKPLVQCMGEQIRVPILIEHPVPFSLDLGTRLFAGDDLIEKVDARLHFAWNQTRTYRVNWYEKLFR